MSVCEWESVCMSVSEWGEREIVVVCFSMLCTAHKKTQKNTL